MSRPPVHGLDIDPQTRCAHWHSPLDIIALKIACCRTYYACRDCHDALADHPAQVWPLEAWNEPAILCGACGTELSIRTYLDCESVCPNCSEPFNPSCHKHLHLYFAVKEA